MYLTLFSQSNIKQEIYIRRIFLLEPREQHKIWEQMRLSLTL